MPETNETFTERVDLTTQPDGAFIGSVEATHPAPSVAAIRLRRGASALLRWVKPGRGGPIRPRK
jgi:hypothetical protein